MMGGSFARYFALGAVVCRLCVSSALGETTTPKLGFDFAPEQIEQKIATYDPQAVEAARGYRIALFTDLAVTNYFSKSIEGIENKLKENNPNLDEDKTKLFMSTFMQNGLSESEKFGENGNVLLLLDTFSKDELIALNQFYSSPMGKIILQKNTSIGGRFLQMVTLVRTNIIPNAIEAARSRLRQDGIEVKSWTVGP